MSVQMQQFRVVGVNSETGADVSVVIDAATKAAAEVKAEKLNIDTTHIVRLKQAGPTPPTEHELFSSEAAEALTTKRTDKLIEEVVTPEEPRQTPQPGPGTTPQTQPHHAGHPPPDRVVAAITRPAYNAPSQREYASAEISGTRVFSLVLLFLLALCGGAYFVLVHEPNAVKAEHKELIFGEDLFTDVIQPTPEAAPAKPLRDAFVTRPPTWDKPDEPLIQTDDQLVINKTATAPTAEPASAGGPTAATTTETKLQLQSVVTSHEGRFAVISGKLYKQGTTVAGHKLLNVADDWVLLEKDGKQRVLTIDAGTTR